MENNSDKNPAEIDTLVSGGRPEWIYGGPDNEREGYKIISRQKLIQTEDYEDQVYIATVYDLYDLKMILAAIRFFEENFYTLDVITERLGTSFSAHEIVTEIEKLKKIKNL